MSKKLPALRTLLNRGDVVTTGYLTKRGGAIRTWRMRFFVLTRQPPELHYFGSEEPDGIAKGVIPLFKGYRLKAAPAAVKKQNCFELGHSTDRAYYCYADGPESLAHWIGHLIRLLDAQDVLSRLSANSVEHELGSFCLSFDVDNSRLRKHFSIAMDYTPLAHELDAVTADEIEKPLYANMVFPEVPEVLAQNPVQLKISTCASEWDSGQVVDVSITILGPKPAPPPQVRMVLNVIDPDAQDEMEMVQLFLFVVNPLDSVLDVEEIRQGMRTVSDSSSDSADRNIWNEALSVETLILQDAQQAGQATSKLTGTFSVKAATLNKLVERLTMAMVKDVDAQNLFMDVFLMTFRSFTTAEQFFDKLIQRYNVPRYVYEFAAMATRLRVAFVMTTWLEHHYSDFSEQLLSAVKHFARRLRADGHPEASAEILKIVSEKSALIQIDPAVAKRHALSIVVKPKPQAPAPPPLVSKASPVTMFDYDDEEIARQLTLMDFALFANIQPNEFFGQAWVKQKAPNIKAYIEHFDRTAKVVASAILLQQSAVGRSFVISRITRVAAYLRQMNNFNTMMALKCALAHTAVKRLKTTFSELPEPVNAAYSAMDNLLSSDNSFAKYRECLRAHTPGVPLIPFLGVHLRDVIFIEDGNPALMGPFKLINFQKCRMLYDVIARVAHAQHCPYNYHPIAQFRTLFFMLPVLSDRQLFALSVHREPRTSTPAQAS